MSAQRVTRRDIERLLLRIEQTIGPEEANLLRAHLSMLESQLRAYQLDNDQISDDALEGGIE